MNKKKASNMTEAEKRDKVASALLRKKDCEDRALSIVGRLTEETPSRDWILEASTHLNQDYFDDIVTERSIIGLCGYPICDKPLTNVAKAKYHISLRDKKVYDTEERKKFCSGPCFKASSYLKDQLDTSPLWIREGKPKKVHLLDESAVAVRSKLPGKGEVIELVSTVTLPPEENLEDHVVIVENSQEDIIIRTCSEPGEKAENPNSSTDQPGTSEPELPPPPGKVKPTEVRKVRFNSNYSGVMDVVTEKRTENQVLEADSVPYRSRDLEEKISVQEGPSLVVSRTLAEWFTETSVKVLRGSGAESSEKREEELIEDLSHRTKNLELQSESKLEINLDLVRETETNLSKYSAFLQGREVYEEQTQFSVKEKSVDEDVCEPRLPLLDRYAQSQHRVRIVLDQLGRYSPALLDLLSVPGRMVQRDLKALVGTFSLGANNITFQPVEWRLLFVVLLQIICEKNEELRRLFHEEERRRNLTILLEQFNLEPAFTNSLLLSLVDNCKTSENIN